MVEPILSSQMSSDFQQGNGITILLVDDDPSILEGGVDLLQFYGYDLLTAADGKAALEIMQSQTPDLIISDIMMPEMDGYEFYEAVRQHPEWTPIPFIFLTARGQQADIRRGHSLGADAYLVKPFEPEDLLIAIQARLKRVWDIQAATQADVEEMKQQLINIFSHELRTPLTYIYGYVNLLQEGFTELGEDAIDEMLVGVQRGAKRLVKLVEDLMMIVRIDSGVVQMEIDHRRYSVALASLVEEAMKKCRENASANNIVLKMDVPDSLVVSVVPTYMNDAIVRLIDNGIKFSPHAGGGEVVVTASAGEDGVQLSVHDEGIGVAPADQKKIFERFVQIDRDAHEQQGTGLGLDIAKQLVELHGGSITIESGLQQGSTFTINIPSIAPGE